MRIPSLIVSVLAVAASAQTPAPGPVVELPPITVTDSRLLPPPEAWRYARIPDFEILSNAADHTTQRLLGDFLRFHQAMSFVWPALQSASEVPASIILCADANKFAEFVPVDTPGGLVGSISLSLRDKEKAAIVLDLQSTVVPIQAFAAGAAAQVGTDPDGMAADYTTQLHREYVHFLLQRIDPQPPAWLEEGLAQIFMGMTYSDDQITFAKLQDPKLMSVTQAAAAAANANSGPGGQTITAPAEDETFNTALAHSALMPMGVMFAVGHDSPTARNPIGGLWPKQCAAFVHLCLYGEHHKYTKAFIEWVDRSTQDGPSEDLFKQCFKMDYAKMKTILRGYVTFADYSPTLLRAKHGQKFPSPPPLNLRAATEAEIGRIKGDALRMAGRPEQAHLNLIAPYIRGSRDPDLLAAIGHDEAESGRPERAKKFLEAAVSGHAVWARAYYDLAQIDYAEDKATPAGRSGLLSPSQLGEVLTALFAARAHRPPMPETYELMANAWLNADATASRGNLLAIDEGVRLFPYDLDLVYADAKVQAKNGRSASAAALCDVGLNYAPNDAARQRFTDLKTMLTAAPR